MEHKHRLLLEEKRKKAMDMHLEFIVDQTAKYSNWLVKGLTTVSLSATPSELSLRSASAVVDGMLVHTCGIKCLSMCTNMLNVLLSYRFRCFSHSRRNK